jgi:WD40 repeat protein
VASLRLLTTGTAGEGHGGEVFGCAYSADGAFVLTAGWDGSLRLWEGSTGSPVSDLQASPKPLSSCAISPDGKTWVSGSMEGMVGLWDAHTHQAKFAFAAHTRPVSCLRFSPDGQHLVTASWDRTICLRKAGREREAKTLGGHEDIVAGCRFTPDGRHLVSWSYDRTVRLWDVEQGQELGTHGRHADRATAGAVAPDGRWAASGGLDGQIKLFDLHEGAEVAAVERPAELRGCFFLLDGETLAAVDAEGWVVLFSLPGLEPQAELGTGVKPQCAELAPCGTQLVLGGEDGNIHLVAVDGLDDAALVAFAQPCARPKQSVFGKLLGTRSVTQAFRYTCPSCQKASEVGQLPSRPIACPNCRRRLRLHLPGRELQKK